MGSPSSSPVGRSVIALAASSPRPQAVRPSWSCPAAGGRPASQPPRGRAQLAGRADLLALVLDLGGFQSYGLGIWGIGEASKQQCGRESGRAAGEGEMCSVRAFRERGGGERAARVLGWWAVRPFMGQMSWLVDHWTTGFFFHFCI